MSEIPLNLVIKLKELVDKAPVTKLDDAYEVDTYFIIARQGFMYILVFRDIKLIAYKSRKYGYLAYIIPDYIPVVPGVQYYKALEELYTITATKGNIPTAPPTPQPAPPPADPLGRLLQTIDKFLEEHEKTKEAPEEFTPCKVFERLAKFNMISKEDYNKFVKYLEEKRYDDALRMYNVLLASLNPDDQVDIGVEKLEKCRKAIEKKIKH